MPPLLVGFWPSQVAVSLAPLIPASLRLIERWLPGLKVGALTAGTLCGVALMMPPASFSVTAAMAALLLALRAFRRPEVTRVGVQN